MNDELDDLLVEQLRRDHAEDPVLFAQEIAQIDPDPWQSNILLSKVDTMVCCSRQSGKSTITGISVAHDVIFKPGLVLVVSPTLRQSLEFFETVSNTYKACPYAPALVEDNKLSLRTPYSRAVALPGSANTIRGFKGPKRIVFDEAAFILDATYAAVRPMRMVRRARIDMLSTPFGKRGFFYKEWSEGKRWLRQQVTAYDIPRFDPEMLEDEKSNPALGEWLFRQEYLCEFVDTLDAVFTHEQVMKAMSAAVEPLVLEAA